MNVRIAAILLCTSAPVALTAQDVNLRSLDEFISVDGEIVGFNGVMLSVRTLVGTLSVPASEVICYGEACLDILANNSFGLTAEDLAGVVAGTTPEVATPLGNDLTIAFASPGMNAFYTSVSANAPGAAVAGTTLTLADGVTIAGADDLSAADIAVQAVSLRGTREAVFSGPSGWSGNPAGLTHQMLGLNAFVVQVSPSTGLTSISTEDLSRVFAGEVTNWAEIGGNNLSVLGLRLPDGSPAYRAQQAILMEPTGRSVANGVLAMGDETGITASVNQFPGSIAIVSAAAANPDLAIPVAGECGIAVGATPFNIISGDYPLVQPVMASYRSGAPASVTGLFDLAAADAAQALGRNFGLLDYSATRQDNATKNARLNGLLNATLDDAQRLAAAAMFQSLFGAERLSTTFYGGAVSGPEAAWNRAQMIDLAEALTKPENAGRQVIFVGIGVSENGSQAAISVSAQAADDLRAAFQAFTGGAITNVTSYGFGDVAATTCVDSQVANGAAAHVEVWLR